MSLGEHLPSPRWEPSAVSRDSRLSAGPGTASDPRKRSALHRSAGEEAETVVREGVALEDEADQDGGGSEDGDDEGGG